MRDPCDRCSPWHPCDGRGQDELFLPRAVRYNWRPSPYRPFRRATSPADPSAGADGWRTTVAPARTSRRTRAVVTLTTHKDDIGRDIYPEVLEMMIDFVARGLTGDGRV